MEAALFNFTTNKFNFIICLYLNLKFLSRVLVLGDINSQFAFYPSSIIV